MQTIYRALCIACGLLAAVSLALLSPHINTVPKACQTHYERNQNLAEEFALLKKPPSVVILGSSLVSSLPSKEPRTALFNLGFPGTGARTGLEILIKLNVYPRLVVIETNQLFMEIQEPLVEHGTNKPLIWLRTQLPLFSPRYAPIPYTASVLSLALDSMRNKANVYEPNIRSSEPPKEELERQKAWLSDKASEAYTTQVMDNLRQGVRELEANGVTCVFLEMPVHRELRMLEHPKHIRAELEKAFPETQYPRCRPGEVYDYVTRDGIHLEGSELRRCSKHIGMWIKEILLYMPITRDADKDLGKNRNRK